MRTLAFILSVPTVLGSAVALAQPGLPSAPAGVEVTRTYGIEFSTIGAPGNVARPPVLPTFPNRDFETPVGNVPYTFRMARTEVTTGQWMEFTNTFAVNPNFPTVLFDQVSFVRLPPLRFAVVGDSTYTGPGYQLRLNPNIPNAENVPVYGLSWRDAAMYCNWLHNGKQSTIESLFSGAYDTSTFELDPNNGFRDQARRSPGARFWIPDEHEWTKAMFFDPERAGNTVASYWTYPNRSDVLPTFGLPGQGQANTGFHIVDDSEYRIPVGSYPSEQSPWGILDGAGSAAEWTEFRDPFGLNGVFFARRGLLGSSLDSVPSTASTLTRIGTLGRESPMSRYYGAGIRLASDIPSPASAVIVVLSVVLLQLRGRR
ncbi:MAG: formylglycine-generating enzyme family protein [Phycisphaerales bacterium]|nr:formylglycine-generating enzyme family protein [Phycisphaerales bacterium]